MRANKTLLLTLLVSFVLAWRASAQGAVVSLQAGVAPFEGTHELEIGARLSPRTLLGVDVSVDVYPGYLVHGAFVGVADFSLAGNLPLGSVAALELRAGPSVLGFVSPGEAGAASGYNAGVGLVITIDSRTSVRADYTYRRLTIGDEAYRIPSLTAGFLVHH
jgi:hypothetical protein